MPILHLQAEIVMKKLYLLLLTAGLALPALAQRPKTAAPVVKRPLTHQVYDHWKTIDEPSLSPDGTWAAYGINPQEGDGKLLLHQLKTNRVDSVPRGYQARLSEDATYAVFKIKPKLEETKTAKRKKKKPKTAWGFTPWPRASLPKSPR
ncbi:MAG: hypothetical protein MUC97_13800 [Bernardetiaceae bacterium]|nr:hypothetical protein [Bernardetiaceae bacterium]